MQSGLWQCGQVITIMDALYKQRDKIHSHLIFVSCSYKAYCLIPSTATSQHTVNDERRVEGLRLTINAPTAVLWQASTKPGQPSLYKELQFAGAADSQNSGGKDRLTFLLSKTALLDP